MKQPGWDASLQELLSRMPTTTPGECDILSREPPQTWLLKTRTGRQVVLQILAFADNPRGVKIRYKLVEQIPGVPGSVSAEERKRSQETLAERLEAATTISGSMEKDKALAALVIDAAKAEEPEIAKKSLWQISNVTKQDQTAHESALLLAKHGLRKQAIEIARTIDGSSIRDKALSELAQ